MTKAKELMIKFKVFRYVNGRNKTRRAWTTVEADSEANAIRKAADKKGVTLVFRAPKIGNFTTTARWMDANDTSAIVSFGAVPR